MIYAKYIGDGIKVSFTNGSIYQCEKDRDGFGDYYSILDDSGEWYRYSVEFFENNFVIFQHGDNCI